jgi:hypothetical protein
MLRFIRLRVFVAFNIGFGAPRFPRPVAKMHLTDAALLVKVTSPAVLKVGKRRFLRLVP